MKIIVTHSSPDIDAITSVWVIKRFLPNWHDASVAFVPAGQRYKNIELREKNSESIDPIEHIQQDEVIHVDTGLGPLDHHQTPDDTVCAASRAWDFVKQNQNVPEEHRKIKEEAVSRMIHVVVDIDHFKEVFRPDPTADYHDFSLVSILDGLKSLRPQQDAYYVEFIMECLDSLLHFFENKVWAEKEIQESGIEFETRWGKAIALETLNDESLHIAQKMGYAVVIRKDPRKGYVRIKARPTQAKPFDFAQGKSKKLKVKSQDVDLTLVYEKLKKADPEATWFLHVSKKMLLNGSTKNPTMKPSTLSLKGIIQVIKNA